MRLHAKLTALSLAAALLLTGCGTTITGVTLGLPGQMERGATGMATPEYAYDGATPEAAKAEELADKLGLQYSSSDPSVVMVDADGNLAALAAGTAEVALTSADGKISASGTITVVVSPTGLTMPEELTFTVGDEAQSAAATVQPADATDQTVTYTSSDEAVAAVDAAGSVTPGTAGEAVITVQLASRSPSCTVTVEEAEAPEPETPAPSRTTGQSDATAPAQSGSGSGSSADSGSTDSGAAQAETPAPAASTAYGAVPFDLAKGSGIWWYIDSSDSAYSAVVENINAYRAAVGAAPLTVDSGLSSIANARCSAMVDTGLTHDGSQTVEIIGQNASSAQAIVDAWANSPDHYNAMVSTQFTRCGVGCYFNEYGWTYWCVTFG